MALLLGPLLGLLGQAVKLLAVMAMMSLKFWFWVGVAVVILLIVADKIRRNPDSWT